MNLRCLVSSSGYDAAQSHGIPRQQERGWALINWRIIEQSRRNRMKRMKMFSPLYAAVNSIFLLLCGDTFP